MLGTDARLAERAQENLTTNSNMDLMNECGICLHIVDDNRECPQCKALFCSACIRSWSRSCPACRFDGTIQEYMHNKARQEQADKVESPCQFGCGSLVPWGARFEHIKSVCPSAKLDCPFAGCNVKAKRLDLDTHTNSCPFGNQYSVESILQSLETQRQNIKDAERRLLKLKAVKSTTPRPTPSDSTQIHNIVFADTLAGIAVRYDVTISELRSANKLFGDSLHGRSYLIIPRPPKKKGSDEYDPNATSEASASSASSAEAQTALTGEVAEGPSEGVVIALRKRKIVSEMVLFTKVTPNEALAYLYLSDYDLPLAIMRYKEDKDWEAKNRKHTQHKSFSEFVKATTATTAHPTCRTCSRMLTADRKHCGNCGVIVCATCVGAGECSKTVRKAALGVTDPASSQQLLTVCNSCFTSISVSQKLL